MATERLLGWKNCTDSCCPMLKLCQLMVVWGLTWMMVRVPGPWAMLALPVLTTPPTGKACAA
jgi:hypothetical protein